MTESRVTPAALRRQQWLEKVDAVLRAHGARQAAQLALQALADGVEHPSLLNLAASARHAEGRFEESVELLKRARALAPKDANILNSLGVCLKASGKTDAALQAYESALKIDPRMAAAHFNRGSILESSSEIKAARSAYERAAGLDPKYVEPLASLAWLDAQSGDTQSARAHGQRALALSPTNVLARMALASVDLQSGDRAAAAARLFELGRDAGLSGINRTIALGLLGDLQDAEGRSAEAFTAYQSANSELKAIYAPQFEAPDIETPLARAKRLTSWFRVADPESWRRAPPQRPRAADPREHIFLVGFPRSGTTLLENILAAHPDVETLEEKECLASVAEPYVASNKGLERLAGIASAEAMRQRDSYWSAVRGFGVEPRGRVFIDKMPLSSTLLPVVAKLFPNARILFARRDPRDVVLSCFRRRFGMNPSMYQLLTLEGAAAYYDAVMCLSEVYRDLLPLPQHVVRYEGLVADFEGTARAACDFLGLEWNEAMRDFAAKARARGISTPSAPQVARGLNREGEGVWRRYADQMGPVLPLLEPWVKRFGYEP